MKWKTKFRHNAMFFSGKKSELRDWLNHLETRYGRDATVSHMCEDRSKFKLGTVSFGTLRTQDLIPGLLNMLRAYDVAEAERISSQIPHTELVLDSGALNQDHPWWSSDEAVRVVNLELFPALNDIAPDGVYFGAHPDCDTDFGFWPVPDGKIVILER